MKKTFNVVMLPSKEQTYQVKEGDLFINYPPYDWGKLEYLKCERVTTMGHAWNGKGIQTYINNLYITSDDEIKAGDWVLTGFPKHTSQVGNGFSDAKNANKDFECKKIVATTDKSIMHLSNNGRVGYPLPNIPESFIKAFVESNGTIKEVELEMEYISYKDLPDDGRLFDKDPITIKTNPDNTVIVYQSKMYSKDKVERLLGKVVADSNSPKYTIQYHEDENKFTMDRIFPLDKWIKDNL